jgi:hypothetical protein
MGVAQILVTPTPIQSGGLTTRPNAVSNVTGRCIPRARWKVNETLGNGGGNRVLNCLGSGAA